MSIGAGIFVMMLGAIFAFAVRDPGGAVDLNVVGVVLIVGGAAGIWLSFYITNRRRRVRTAALDPAVEEEYRIVEDSGSEDGTVTTDFASARRRLRVRREVRNHDVPAQESAPVRRVDLDPAASGLHTPAPDRRVLRNRFRARR